MRTFTRRQILKITAVAAGALLLPAARSRRAGLYTLAETRVLMNTLIHLTLVTRDPEQGRAALQATFDEMARLVRVFDHRDPESPLAALNRAGRLDPAPQELVQVMGKAQRCTVLSGGAFDVTVKPVLDALRDGRAPTGHERGLVGRAVEIDGRCIELGSGGTAVTLDGIAKGYVVDRGVAALQAHGFDRVLVEAGGDLAARRVQADGHPWHVAVAHPRPEQISGYLARFSLGEGAVATSGDYVRFFEPDRSAHHIVDPRTGTSPQELAAATVIAPSAALADGLSTALMVMGAADGLALANRLEGVEALVVTKALQVRRTAGFPRSEV